MAGASADGEVNHWPAFVDVLTTVIMVVTFLLVIMSAAVMALTQKVVKNIRDQIIAEQQVAARKGQTSVTGEPGRAQDTQRELSPRDAEDGSSIAELGAVLTTKSPIDGDDRLTILTRDTPETLKLKVKAIEQAAPATGVEVTAADVLLRLDFEPMAVSVDAEISGKISAFLKTRMQPGMKYEIWSFAPQTASVSEAERLAYYRAAVTRNVLVRAGIPPSAILTQIRTTDPMSKDGHNVRVVLKP